MEQRLFLLTSKRVAQRLTEVFDFVWPTAVAIWNLRWQVGGLVSVSPHISEAELLGRFVSGSGIRGANLRRACIEKNWEQQQQEFARFLLFEFCALYETWCEGCIKELGLASKLSKDLQFPTTIQNGTIKAGIGHVLAPIKQSNSPALSSAIYPTLQINRKNSMTHIEDLLICYRYFKEVRNALIHNGGSVSTKFTDAESAYKLLTPASLGVKVVPEFYPYIPGSPIALNLRGVAGFGDIILRIVCSIDIEISRSSHSERIFIDRWKEKYGSSPIQIKAATLGKSGRIKKLVQKMGFPIPKDSSDFEQLLRSNSLVF